jgi:hypothetical protein
MTALQAFSIIICRLTFSPCLPRIPENNQTIHKCSKKNNIDIVWIYPTKNNRTVTAEGTMKSYFPLYDTVCLRCTTFIAKNSFVNWEMAPFIVGNGSFGIGIGPVLEFGRLRSALGMVPFWGSTCS